MKDSESFIAVLVSTGVPHSVFEDKEYSHVTIEANASDKYVTVTFKDGKFAYSN